MIAEKPYIAIENDKYILMVPNVEANKSGVSKDFTKATKVDFSKVYVTESNDSVEKINAKIVDGNHIVFQPGIYNLNGSIVVNNPNTVLLGLGLATLIPANGKPCI